MSKLNPNEFNSAGEPAGRALVSDGAGSTEWGDTVLPATAVVTSHRMAFMPTFNGIVDLLGWHDETDIAVALASGSPITASIPGYHSHFHVVVADAVGAPFTIRVTGRSIEESSAVETPGDTEDLAITADGDYQTAKSWIDAPQFSIVEGSKSCNIDLMRISYWDKGNQDFTIKGVRVEWEPDSVTWSLEFHIHLIGSDGTSTVILDTTFSNLDTVPHAERNIRGKYKRTDLNYLVNGADHEGIHVAIDQTGIRYFFYEVRYL